MYFNLPSLINKEQDNWPLWIPIIFGAGTIFYFSVSNFFNADLNSLIAPAILLIFAIITAINLVGELRSLIAIAIAIFLSAFLWSSIYDAYLLKAPEIDSQIYVGVKGSVESIKEYEGGSKRVILSNLTILEGKSNKKTSKNKENSTQDLALSKKPFKINKNTLKTYLNLENYTQIDRNLGKDSELESFIDGKLQNPPKKISITLKKVDQELKIGDKIEFNAFLQPIKESEEIDSFNFKKYYYFQQIGATGFSVGDLEIVDSKPTNKNKIDIWRYKMAKDIRDDFKNNKDEAAIFIALSLGIKDFISPDLMVNIRKSGLAHLLAISGLHMSMAAAIFFIFFRFILSRSQGLTLRFNIKKISAILAIISSFTYLIITGSPVSAIRAFLIILVFFLAVVLDKNHNPLRSLALAAMVILIINPSSIYAVGFQMSFVAILSLITFYNILKHYKNNEEGKNIVRKFLYYFIGILTSSIVAQSALTPVIIYYFNNYAFGGVLANLIAIPITSFIVMPLAFVYLFLSIFNLEIITTYPLDIALKHIIEAANFTANLKFSSVNVPSISDTSIILMLIGFLWFCLWQEKWRYFGFAFILIGAILAIKTPQPDLIIDGNRQFFAIYDSNKGLFFSKKVRESKRVTNLMQKMAQNEFRTIDELEDENIFCEYEYCFAKVKERQILVLTNRNKINFICNAKYDILVNLSKFKLPSCVDSSKQIINNVELEKLGSKYLYF